MKHSLLAYNHGTEF